MPPVIILNALFCTDSTRNEQEPTDGKVCSNNVEQQHETYQVDKSFTSPEESPISNTRHSCNIFNKVLSNRRYNIHRNRVAFDDTTPHNVLVFLANTVSANQARKDHQTELPRQSQILHINCTDKYRDFGYSSSHTAADCNCTESTKRITCCTSSLPESYLTLDAH